MTCCDVTSWQCLQLQDALGQPCSKCSDADARRQEVESQLSTLEHTLQHERQTCDSHQKYIDELESSLNTAASDISMQVSCE